MGRGIEWRRSRRRKKKGACSANMLVRLSVDTSLYTLLLIHWFDSVQYIGIRTIVPNTSQHTYLKFKIIIHFASVDFRICLYKVLLLFGAAFLFSCCCFFFSSFCVLFLSSLVSTFWRMHKIPTSSGWNWLATVYIVWSMWFDFYVDVVEVAVFSSLPMDQVYCNECKMHAFNVCFILPVIGKKRMREGERVRERKEETNNKKNVEKK